MAECGVECGVESTLFGVTLVCEKEAGHDGLHGSGPFVEYTTEWPDGVGELPKGTSA
jgi:hypothetical protein